MSIDGWMNGVLRVTYCVGVRARTDTLDRESGETTPCLEGCRDDWEGLERVRRCAQISPIFGSFSPYLYINLTLLDIGLTLFGMGDRLFIPL